MRNSKNVDHSGSTFDSFLEEEQLLEDAEAVAIKRVIAWQLEKAMQGKRITKKAMAKYLNTSRSQVDRLLDPAYVGISLETVSKAAHAVGKRVQIQFVESSPKRKHGKRPPANVRSFRRGAVNGGRLAAAE